MTDERYGELEIDGDHATITFRRHLPYPVATVWAALTDPDERAAWFGDTVIDGRDGGTIEMVAAEPPPFSLVTGPLRPSAVSGDFTHPGRASHRAGPV